MADFKNEYSFSFSRHAQLKECPRQYYWRRYGYWNGWKKGATREMTKAWRLKNLTSPAMFMGSLVHDEIAKDLENIKRRIPSGADSIKAESVAYDFDKAISRAYEQSERCAFLEDKEAVTFAGDYYESMSRWKKDPGELCAEAVSLFMNYYRSGLRGYLKKNPLHIRSVEALESMEVMKVRVYIKMDLLMKSKKVTHLIVDWKTGKRSESYRDQLALYGLYLHNLGIPLDQIQFATVYLKEGLDIMEEEPRFTEFDLERTRERILREIVEEQELVIGEIKHNVPKPMEVFPMNRGNACRFCNYRELCGIEQGATGEHGF